MKHLHKNVYVSGQITDGDFEMIKAAGIKTIINNRPDAEEAQQLSSIEAKKLAQEHDIDYHYLPMSNGQPLPENLVSEFKAVIENANGNVLVHCKSGMRSSFIWALGQIPVGEISVDDAINKAQSAGIPLSNARSVLETVKP